MACSLFTLLRRFSTMSMVVCTPRSAMIRASSSSSNRSSSIFVKAPRTPSTPPRMFFLVLSRPAFSFAKKPVFTGFSFSCPSSTGTSAASSAVSGVSSFASSSATSSTSSSTKARASSSLSAVKTAPSSSATTTSSSARGFSAKISPAMSVSSSRRASASSSFSAVSSSSPSSSTNAISISASSSSAEISSISTSVSTSTPSSSTTPSRCSSTVGSSTVFFFRKSNNPMIIYSLNLLCHAVSTAFSASEKSTEISLEIPFSCIVTPYSTSACSMVPFLWVITMNWVSCANHFRYWA